ncbi:MAG TPA: hypothetical protein VFQ68_32775, partial [Streptosporangiaceae bacterium]|nr:hypothetical protein [Streptosporangiaceae bacterium]
MTRASDTQDQEGARKPGIRGWFQPLGPAADGDDGEETNPVSLHRPDANRQGTGTGSGDAPAQVSDETTVFPRILATDAGEDELPTAGQAPEVPPAAPRADDSEPPTADASPADASPADAGTSDPAAELPDETTVFLRVPPPGTTPPGTTPPKVALAGRPPDITRPQLILDDTMVDMAAVRADRKPGGAGSAGSGIAAPPAAGTDATSADRDASGRGASAGEGAAGGKASGSEDAAGGNAAPAGKSAKRNRSVFGPEPASRPDMLTNAETVVMASLKDPQGAMPGESPQDRDAAAKTRNAAAVREPAITAMVPVGTNAAFAEATTQVMSTVKPSGLRSGAGRGRLGKPRAKRDRAPAPPRRYTPERRTTMISRMVLLAILLLQAVLSLRLHNTAFEDEATYLYAGHMELQHLLHGAALQGQYASY